MIKKDEVKKIKKGDVVTDFSAPYKICTQNVVWQCVFT
jgi:hypothetical protein